MSHIVRNWLRDAEKVGLFEALLFLVGATTLVALVALYGGFFVVPGVLLAAAILTVACFGLLGVRPVVSSLPRLTPTLWAAVLIGILLAVLFRIDIFPYLSGGQDQGVYVNMAAAYMREGGINWIDHFRASLPVEVQGVYDQGKLPGFTLVDPSTSLVTGDFYPAHPIWMAIALWLFGDGLHTLSLLGFSFLGLAGTFFFTRDFFEDERAGVIAFLLCAINPALSFFSKFPVGEMVAYGFAINGALMIFRAIQATSPARRRFSAALAVLLFVGFFFTRWTFFMYAPFFVILMASVVLPLYEAHQRRMLIAIPLLLLAVYAGSLRLYQILQAGLFNGLVDSFPPTARLFFVWPELFPLAGLVVAVLAIGCQRIPAVACGGRWSALLLRWTTWMVDRRWALWGALPLVLFLTIPSVLVLSATGTLSVHYHVAPPSYFNFRFHNLYRLAMMMSPIALVFLSLAPVLAARAHKRVVLLAVFFVVCWVVNLANPGSPYLYYYGRYLVSELLPVALILTSVLASGLIAHAGRLRLLAIGILVVTIGYALVFSGVQVGKVEGESGDYFWAIKEHVGPDDVVVGFLGEDPRGKVSTPLQVYLNCNHILIPGGWLLDGRAQRILQYVRHGVSPTGRLFLLSNTLIFQDDGMPLLRAVAEPKFEEGVFSNSEHTHHNGAYYGQSPDNLLLPYEYVTKAVPYTLYEVLRGDSPDVAARLLSEQGVATKQNSIGVLLLGTGWSSPERWGTWSIGHSATVSLPLSEGDGDLALIVSGRAYVRKEHPIQTVQVYANGVLLDNWVFRHGDSEAGTRRAVVPAALLGGSTHIELTFHVSSPMSPRRLGFGADDRQLGFGLEALRLMRVGGIRAPLVNAQGRTLQFASGSADNDSLVSGWSSPGAWGTWSNSNRALLRLQAPEFGQDFAMLVRARSFISAAHPEQTVHVGVNAQPVGTWHFRRGGKEQGLYRVVIPRAMVSANAEMEIGFILPDAISPRAVSDIRDDRLLGIGLESLRLVGAHGPDDIPTDVRERKLGFADGSGDTLLLGSGWSEPERWGVWSVGRDAVLELPLARSVVSDLVLTATAHAYVTAEHPEQRVGVVINGESLETLSFRVGDSGPERTVVIPATVAARQDPMVVEFRMHNPISPAALKRSADDRVLGLGLVGLRITDKGGRDGVGGVER